MEIFSNFIGIFQLSIKGFLIGILASAPMGPIGILCIRRTMRKGRVYGLITGVGAAISDLIYAIFTGLGMSFLVSFIENERYIFFLKIVGSIMLLIFGIWTLRSDPKKIAKPTLHNKGKGSLSHNLITGFLLTLSNPLIIFLFIATFNMFTFFIPDYIFGMTIGYISILSGALFWWYMLTFIITKAQKNFGIRGIVRLNQSIGWSVIFFALIYALTTCFNISIYKLC